MKKKFLIAVLVVLVAAVAALLLSRTRMEPEPPLPNPNGGQDFAAAAALLNANPPDWQGMQGEAQHAALRALVATNQPALDLVRRGLTKECRVVPYEINATNSTHFDNLSKTKALALTLAAASRLALIESRTNDAAAFAVDCIRFGNESARGGVLIDGLVGIAIKSIGLGHLKPAVEGLNLEGTRKALSDLETIRARSESADEVIKRERQWALRGRFGAVGIVGQLVQPFLSRKALDRGRQKMLKSETDIRRMQIQLAAHAFELEHGKPPTSTRELTPQYLKSVPLNPETGKEMPLD